MKSKRPFRITISSIHGKGVIANRNIKAGEKIPHPYDIYPHAKHPKKLWIQRNFGGFNHSCAPNVQLIIPATHGYDLVAIQDIKHNEELTLYYGRCMHWNCNCPVCHNKGDSNAQ